MADTPPSAERTIILFPRSWQRLLLYLAFGLLFIWFPFMGAFAAASSPSAAHVYYPAAATIAPIINLTLALMACAAILGELPRAKRLDRSLFVLFLAVTTGLLVVTYDSSVHLLHIVGVNLGLPTADNILPLWSNVAWVLVACCVIVPNAIKYLRKRREQPDRP